MNPQILFNSSLALLTTGVILLLKGLFILGFTSLIVAIGASTFWLMSGFFGKFKYESIDKETSQDDDEEGKGVLKPF